MENLTFRERVHYGYLHYVYEEGLPLMKAWIRAVVDAIKDTK